MESSVLRDKLVQLQDTLVKASERKQRLVAETKSQEDEILKIQGAIAVVSELMVEAESKPVVTQTVDMNKKKTPRKTSSRKKSS